MGPLISEEALATDRLGISPEHAADLRRRHDWPHVRLGRAIRYTEDQVEQIVESMTHGTEIRIAGRRRGLTPGSARRAS